MTLTPLDQYDPRLRQVCADITKVQLRSREQQLEIEAILDFVYDVTNKNTSSTMRDTSRPSTVGLSGNQVGIMKRLCAVDLAIGHQGYTDMHVLINPRIIWRSKARTQKPEGCVNFPTIWGITQRSKSIKVAALDRSGNELILKVDGWASILLQHEIDHLEGALFIDSLIDPTHAHLVTEEEYPAYRKAKAESWTRFIDVSGQVQHNNSVRSGDGRAIL